VTRKQLIEKRWEGGVIEQALQDSTDVAAICEFEIPAGSMPQLYASQAGRLATFEERIYRYPGRVLSSC